MFRRSMSLIVLLCLASSASAIDDAHWRKAQTAIERGIAYLRTTQNEEGSWTPQPGPAITAMVVNVMLTHPNIPATDPVTVQGLRYILNSVNDDGSIHRGILSNYNTAICLSALSRVNDRPDIASVITRAQNFLITLQWNGQADAQNKTVDQTHPYFGGAGYGKHGRPDLSNTQIMLQGLYDSGLDCNSPPFKRAMVFISRCQGVTTNTMLGDKIENDGGFIYATSVNKDLVGVPQSMASPDMIDEAKAGRAVSGLRTYGSMTYAGFKSYLYAQLDRDDARVVAAYDWIRNHYTVDHNPGMPESVNQQGLYYYYLTMARALNAWGHDTITTTDKKTHDWANDLISALVARQREDGSWVNDTNRWMESDANLVTAYALIALQNATR